MHRFHNSYKNVHFLQLLGSVFVGVKDIVIERSSPFRHMSELHSVLQNNSFSKLILFIYSDGGPDHRLTYVNVQLSLICLFLKFDLDNLCAGRTAPHQLAKSCQTHNGNFESRPSVARTLMSSEFESITKVSQRATAEIGFIQG